MIGEDAGRPISGNADELLRKLVDQVEELLRRVNDAPGSVINQTSEPVNFLEVLYGLGRQPVYVVPEPNLGISASMVGLGHEEAAEIDRIIARLDAGIAKETEAMEALLSRLRRTRIAA
jgi:hypothetical protein